MCVLGSRSVLSNYNPMDCSSPGFSVHGLLQAIVGQSVQTSSYKLRI